MSSSAVTTAQPKLGTVWGILHIDVLCNSTARIRVCQDIGTRTMQVARKKSRRDVPLALPNRLDLEGGGRVGWLRGARTDGSRYQFVSTVRGEE
jgi:hypothetical protein